MCHQKKMHSYYQDVELVKKPDWPAKNDKVQAFFLVSDLSYPNIVGLKN